MPITCLTCRRDNDPWRRHCGGCGSYLAGGCPTCHFINRADDRFCGGCAKSLRAIPSVVKTAQPTFGETTPIDIRDVISETNS
jgi:hypothetical protein